MCKSFLIGAATEHGRTAAAAAADDDDDDGDDDADDDDPIHNPHQHHHRHHQSHHYEWHVRGHPQFEQISHVLRYAHSPRFRVIDEDEGVAAITDLPPNPKT